MSTSSVLALVLLASATSFKAPPAAAASSRRSVLAAASSLLGAAAPQSSANADEQNNELDTSPLIDELKRRTAAKQDTKEQNTVSFKFVAYDERQGEVMVRYQSVGDELPVSRRLGPNQIKELESRGFMIKCPSWGGECALFFGPARMP